MRQPVATALLVLTVMLTGTACSPATEMQSPAVACPASAIRGTLEVLGTDLGLFDTDNRHLLIHWPAGYTSREVAGRLSLIDPAGRVIAGVGDAVEIPGGELRVGDWSACGDPVVRRVVAP